MRREGGEGREKQKQREVKSKGKKRERVLGAGREGRQVTTQAVTDTVTDTHGHRHWTHGTSVLAYPFTSFCHLYRLKLPLTPMRGSPA